MKIYNKIYFVILFTILFLNIFFSFNSTACKDIVAVGNATEGDYNLLLKVRDPSRPGIQVLCIIPEGYEYSYHHPWSGKLMEFTTECKYIGVATEEDTIPNIVKAGMAISSSGIAYGDADTGSKWKNPTMNGWDDFDWIRYACEKAKDEDEAVKLMTEDCVDKLHASSVSENLFIVGPENAYLIEADAYRYKIKAINDVLVMSNYPKELWKSQMRRTIPIAPSFDADKEKYVTVGRTIRLNSLFGVRIVKIGDDFIVARQVPFIKFSNYWMRIMGNRVKIYLGERETVGDYSIELLDIDGRRAKISMKYVFNAWEEKMMEYINSRIGDITISDMINWSRLHEEDLDGLRPMCEDLFEYESVMIYKIPQKNYDILSSGWFSANHACSSIYVPIHIADTDIHKAYTSGEAAKLSIELLDIFGHETLSSAFSLVEGVFLKETEELEEISEELIKNNSNVAEFLTIIDIGMQKQALLTEKICMEIGKNINQKDKQEIFKIINNIWDEDYKTSLNKMSKSIESYGLKITEYISDIALAICKSRIDAAEAIGKNVSVLLNNYENGEKLIRESNYNMGFKYIIDTYNTTNSLIKEKSSSKMSYFNNNEISIEIYLVTISFICFVVVIFFYTIKRKS